MRNLRIYFSYTIWYYFLISVLFSTEKSDAQKLTFQKAASIEITSPDQHPWFPAPEEWLAYSEREITWISSGVDSVQIEYSVNGGSSWKTIISNLSAIPGHYNWTVPNEPSSDSFIKVSDCDNPSVFDVSNVFTILSTTQLNTTFINMAQTPSWAVDVDTYGNYAFVAAMNSGLRIFDISDNYNIYEIGFVNTPGFAQGLDAVENFVFVADDNGGLRIIDYSNPSSPFEVSFYPAPGRSLKVETISNLAFVAAGSSGLRIIDLSDLSKPKEIGYHDTPGFANEVKVRGNYAYIADGTQGIRIIDISNPQAPNEVGNYSPPGNYYRLAVRNDYLYVTTGNLIVLNISDPTNPLFVGSCLLPTNGSRGIKLHGDFAYVATENPGLRIINITDPINPFEVGYFNTPSPGFSWMIDSRDNLVFIADDENGLTIVRNDLLNIGWIRQISGTTSTLNSILFTNHNDGWAVGENGILLKTTNSGQIWLSQNTPEPYSINSIYFIDSDTGYFSQGVFSHKIYKTTNSGSSWFAVDSISHYLFELKFPTSSTGYGVGIHGAYADGVIVKTSDYGDNWTTIWDPLADLQSIDFTDNNTGWVVGDNNWDGAGIIYKTTNGGTDWIKKFEQQPDEPYYNRFRSVCCFGSSKIWAVGNVGMILHSDDGGETWNEQTSNTFEHLLSVDFTNEFTGWTVGSNGVILKTTNGGLVWELQSSGVVQDLNSVSFIDEFSGWISGRDGIIINTGDSGLPVELISFNASLNNQTVNLTWQTATEINNYGFEIERQETESRIQNSEWKKIGFVEGHGNSFSPKSYTYVDRNPVGGSKFLYRLKQIDTDGSYEYSEIVEIELTPSNYELFQNYPNPFNPITTIKFGIVKPANVILSIFNVLGEKVISEKFTKLDIGFHEYKFDAEQFSSGVYFYSIEIGNRFNDVKKMLLLK